MTRNLPDDISVYITPAIRQLLSFSFASIFKSWFFFWKIRVSISFLSSTYWFSIDSFLTVCRLVLNTIHARLVRLRKGLNHCISCEAVKCFIRKKISTNGPRISSTFALHCGVNRLSKRLPRHVTTCNTSFDLNGLQSPETRRFTCFRLKTHVNGIYCTFDGSVHWHKTFSKETELLKG